MAEIVYNPVGYELQLEHAGIVYKVPPGESEQPSAAAQFWCGPGNGGGVFSQRGLRILSGSDEQKHVLRADAHSSLVRLLRRGAPPKDLDLAEHAQRKAQGDLERFVAEGRLTPSGEVVTDVRIPENETLAAFLNRTVAPVVGEPAREDATKTGVAPVVSHVPPGFRDEVPVTAGEPSSGPVTDRDVPRRESVYTPYSDDEKRKPYVSHSDADAEKRKPTEPDPFRPSDAPAKGPDPYRSPVDDNRPASDAPTPDDPFRSPMDYPNQSNRPADAPPLNRDDPNPSNPTPRRRRIV